MSSRVGFTLRNMKRVFHVCFVALEHTCVFEVPAVQREPHEPLRDQKSLLALQAKGEAERRQAHGGVSVFTVPLR